METMTSIERVRAAARGLPCDRPPFFLWLNAHAGARLMSGLRPSSHRSWNAAARWFWRRFRQDGGREPSEFERLAPLVFDIHTFNWANLYAVELGSDILMAAQATPWWYARFFRREGRLLMRDYFGVERALGNGIYPDMVGPVIRDRESLRSYRLPDLSHPKYYGVFRRARKLHPGTAIAAEIWGPQDFTATSMFGMERFMTMLVDYPEDMHAFLKRWTDWWVDVIPRCVDAGADTIAIYDDYGYDHRTLISMKMWKEFSWPYLRRYVDAAREAGALVMLHSCGYQKPLLPYYVEAGIDLLQSYQPKAGNDLTWALEEYGDRLGFITGIDIQRGEAMSPDELRAEILHNAALGRGKRFILGTTHEIQHTMPLANVSAILSTVREIVNGAKARL